MSDKIKLNIEDLETIFQRVLYQHRDHHDTKEELISVMISKASDMAKFISKYTGSKLSSVSYDNETGIEVEMEKGPLPKH
jgi:hypothetical protein